MQEEIINFENGKVDRKFTKEWSTSGIINMDKIPSLVQSLVDQKKSMLAYIEVLHDKLDYIMQKNHICDIPECHIAGCTSDHK